MSNLLQPLELHLLEAVTAGSSKTAKIPSSTGSSLGTSSKDLLNTLTSLSNTLKDIGTTASKSGFSMTEILMLGLLMNQNRGSVNVFVRRPF